MSVVTEKYNNLAQTTLNGGINNSVTSITVTDGSVFPTTGNFRLIIGTEILKCTARSSNVLTVVRGQEGNAAASHSDLDPVYGSLTAGAFDQILADMVVSDTFANLPTAEKAGRLFLAQDTPYFLYDDGTNWKYCSQLFKFTPPVLSDFTWLNQGSCTTDTTLGGLRVNVVSDSSGSINLRVLHKSKTAPYKITGYFIFNHNGWSYESCGMGFYDPTSGRLVTMHFIVFNSDFSYVECCRWESTTSFTSAPGYMFMSGSGNLMGWMQIENDGTNIYFRMSNDGYTWFTVYSEGKTAYMTTAPTKAIVYGRNQTGQYDFSYDLLSWKEE